MVVVEQFAKVFGIGPLTANKLYDEGMRTLDDLRRRPDMPKRVKLGLLHFDDMQVRIPREEVEEIAEYVKAALRSVLASIYDGKKANNNNNTNTNNDTLPSQVIFASMEINICGSYRRGKTSCGDVDILITHPDSRYLVGLLPRVLSSLHSTNFLVGDLSDGVHESDEGSYTYMGLCRLPATPSSPPRLVRRLDIKLYPPSQYCFALLYFTGSAYFNRSMRAFCHTKGLRLSDHSLTNVIRLGKGQRGRGNHSSVGGDAPSVRETIVVSKVPNMLTERDIFDYLGLEYKSPEERDVG